MKVKVVKGKGSVWVPDLEKPEEKAVYTSENGEFELENSEAKRLIDLGVVSSAADEVIKSPAVINTPSTKKSKKKDK